MAATARAGGPAIATLTLNAALDRTLHLDGELRPGHKGRVVRESVQAGGKGVNVARVASALGAETLAIVVLGGDTGRRIAEDLAQDGLPARTVEAAGESRTCLEVVEPGGRAIQLHGEGVAGGGPLLERVVAAVEALPGDTSWLAICGSLPPGMPDDGVAALVRTARARGLRVAVDTRGKALAHAIEASPDLVRINRQELAEVGTGGGWQGLRCRIVSDGADPFDAWSDGSQWRVRPPRVRAMNPIGCGDAMMGALLVALAGGASFEDALRRATALAAAEACSPLAGRPDLALARSLDRDVELVREV